MAIFSSNKDLDSTIMTIGINVAMLFALYLRAIDKIDNATLSMVIVAWGNVSGFLFGKGKAEAEAERKNGGTQK